MSRLQRIGVFISGLFMLLGAAVLILDVEDGLMFITTVLAVSLFVMGIRFIVYFLTMARHMVGGRAMLFAGVFLLDFGFFTATMFDESRLMIILYLAILCTFLGYLLQNLALTRISDREVSLLQSLCPVMTAVFSFILLGEKLSAAGITGAVIIIACISVSALIKDEGNQGQKD